MLQGKSLGLAIVLMILFGFQGLGQYYSKRVKDWNLEEVPDSSLLEHSVFLIGDLGEGNLCTKSIRFFKKEIQKCGKDGTVLLLGNSVMDPRYDSEEPDLATGDPRLRLVLDLVKDHTGEVFVLPGEREWDRGRKHGWDAVKRHELFVENYLQRGDVFLPSSGCPGPVEIPLSDEVVLIIVDSQWWLHQGDKPSEECGFEDPGDFLIQMNDALARNKEKKIIFATHHPAYSAGKYAGHYPFPGPVALYRMLFGTAQDFAHPYYKRMRYYVARIFKNLNEVIFVAGHENSLQYLKKGNVYQVVAGSGNQVVHVGKGKMDFTDKEVGFARLNFYRNDEVWVEFWGTGAKGDETPRMLFRKHLYTRKVTSEEELARAYKKLDFSDSTVVVPASRLYHTDSRFKKKMLGENYRQDWGQAIRVPVFDIGKEHGGLRIVKRGGGQQTRSLRLEDGRGRQYVLRSIEKYTEKAIPEVLRGSFAAQVVQDGISGSHPYAAIAVPKLADAAGVYHTNPKIVYVPDDPRFGTYQDDFKNELYLYEERPDGDLSDMPWFGNSDKIISTDKVLQKKQQSSDFRIDEKSVLRARLFDIFLNDWDRHDDQWRWATFEKEGIQWAQPIPRDRDQVFFYNEGWIPWLSRRKWAIRKFQPFDTVTQDLAGLGFNARYFDRTFLGSLERNDWEKMGQELKKALSDEVIELAVEDLPQEVAKISGEEIKRKLKARRDRLPEMAVEYYDFLAQKVDVVGTDEREKLKVERHRDGTISVKMWHLSKTGNLKEQLYERTFHPDETQEVRLYGLGGKDKFKVSGSGTKDIRLRLIGGSGKDKFEHEATGVSRRATWIYDTPKKTSIKGNKKFINRLGTQEDVNLYDRKAFKYNMLSPAVNVNFISDDGLILGAGAALKTHGFRKEPYASLHKFLASYSFRYPSVKLEYSGEMNRVFRGLDVLMDVSYHTPNFQGNYFGLGNTTELPHEEEEEYNRIRMARIFANPMLRKRIGNHHQLAFGAFYQRTKLNATANRFVTDPENPFYDLDPDVDFEARKYWGANLRHTWDTRNSEILPTSGLYWITNWSWFKGIGSADENFHQINSDLRFYFNFGRPERSVLAVRVGAAHNSDGYPFFEANKLGIKTNLRGYRQNRFAGDDMVYQNTDFRLRLMRFHTYFLGGELGMLAFNDVGRVWLQGEDSNRWHHGYGGGFWLSPYRLLVVTASYGHSREDNLFSLQFSYLF